MGFDVVVVFDATHGTRNGIIQWRGLGSLLDVSHTPQHPAGQHVDAGHVRLHVFLVHFLACFTAGDVEFGME